MRALTALVVGLAGAFSLPVLAAGPFTGTIEMTITNDKAGQGSLKITLGDPGLVSELQMPSPRGPMTVKSLLLNAHPETVYLINDAAKSYGEIAVPPQPAAATGDDETWTVKKLGTDTVAGYSAVHVTATSSKGNVLELWTAKDIMDAADFVRAQKQGNSIPAKLITALKAADAGGFFAKMVSKGKDGSTTTMLLTKVTKGPLPPATFELPAGYTKATMPGAAAALPPDVQKKLDEKMKTLTPEQQEAMKKALAGQH